MHRQQAKVPAFWGGRLEGREAIGKRTSGRGVRSVKLGGVLASGWGRRVSSEGHHGGLLEEVALTVSLE